MNGEVHGTRSRWRGREPFFSSREKLPFHESTSIPPLQPPTASQSTDPGPYPCLLMTTSLHPRIAVVVFVVIVVVIVVVVVVVVATPVAVCRRLPTTMTHFGKDTHRHSEPPDKKEAGRAAAYFWPYSLARREIVYPCAECKLDDDTVRRLSRIHDGTLDLDVRFLVSFPG